MSAAETSVAQSVLVLQGNARTRELVTPEGVDLGVVLADASERASAFLLDVVFMVLGLVALTLVLGGVGLAFSFSIGEYLAALWLLGFFLLRVFYFTAFEITARPATPGKRVFGLRVIRRDGGARSADAVFARNAVRAHWNCSFRSPLSLRRRI